MVRQEMCVVDVEATFLKYKVTCLPSKPPKPGRTKTVENKTNEDIKRNVE